MSRSLLGVASVFALATTLGACGGKNDQAKFQAAVDSMTPHRDSTVNALDSTGTHRQVDTVEARYRHITCPPRKTVSRSAHNKNMHTHPSRTRPSCPQCLHTP